MGQIAHDGGAGTPTDALTEDERRLVELVRDPELALLARPVPRRRRGQRGPRHAPGP